VLSDGVYRIQKSRKTKPKVVYCLQLDLHWRDGLLKGRRSYLPREEETEASDVDFPVFLEDG